MAFGCKDEIRCFWRPKVRVTVTSDLAILMNALRDWKMWNAQNVLNMSTHFSCLDFSFFLFFTICLEWWLVKGKFTLTDAGSHISSKTHVMVPNTRQIQTKSNFWLSCWKCGETLLYIKLTFSAQTETQVGQ